ncbi:serine hydroxymethyltransferase [Streptomyces thioluteus]|uniref:Serine hydroxymethyltransferase n=1 Tax=Streptomyces thioluteus TaxID=66431 RepID=A0ABN3WFG6_STRTU
MSVTSVPPGAARTASEALLRQDPEMAGILLAEAERQATGLQLIAAENFTSPAVLAALASPLADKYAEGYPGARHHGGCEVADLAERVATDRAKALFGAEHANVQPHSGSSAVLAAYAALLRPGDKVLAMGLREGGHLTHGSPANFSGRWFDFTGYGVHPDTGLIDYDRLRALALAHRPRAIVCGSTSYPRHPDIRALPRDRRRGGTPHLIVGRRAHPSAWSPGGAAPNPVPYADVVCATTHKVLRGPRAAGCCCAGARLADRVDRAGVPVRPGRRPDAHRRRQGRRLRGGCHAGVHRVRHQVVANARALAAALAEEGLAVATGARTPTWGPPTRARSVWTPRGPRPAGRRRDRARRLRPGPGARRAGCGWAPRRSPPRAWAFRRWTGWPP